MKQIKKLVVLLLSLSMVLGLVGCANSNNEVNKVTSTPTVTVTPTVENTEVEYPITITDSFGNEVIIEKEPTKVVSGGPNITEMIYALGAEDKLVGRTDYCDYPEKVSEIPSIGTLYTPDIEKITSLEPDVVFTSTHFDEDVANKLKELGIAVVGLYNSANYEGAYDIINIAATVLNKKQEAKTQMNEMKTLVSDVQSKVSDLEKKSVYYVVGYGEYGDSTATGDTFINEMIGLAGAINVAADGTNWSYSLERLLEVDPDVILVRTGEKDSFMNADGYKDLTAVKEGNVFEIESNLLDRQGVRNALGIEAIAKLVYPDAF